MLKISFLLSLVNLSMLFARCPSGDCGTFVGNPLRSGYEHRSLIRKRHRDDFCSSSSSSSRRDSDCSSSSDSSFCDSGSSDFCDRRSRKRRRDWYDDCSDSSDECSPIPCPPICPPIPNRCDAILTNLLRDMDNALIAFLRNFETQYRQQITTFFGSVSSEISGFSPVIPTFDYAALVQSIAAQAPGIPLPANLAANLASIQATAVSRLISDVQSMVGTVLNELLKRINDLCLNELIALVNGGLLGEPITTALSRLSSEIPAITASIVREQLGLLQGLGLPPAAITLATTALQGNEATISGAITSALTALTNSINGLLSSLTTTLSSIITTQVKAFQNLAITKINAIVTAIFGTTGVPAPIPPV